MIKNKKQKVLGEVDRCLKKVTEGADAFEDIWQKVQNATNVNQKEKYESELKREIKKLQRLREQIKTWLASSDIKDKKPLLENRKLIEIQMERFRIIEKETKTKAYSKEGLGQANKIDPETKQYETCREWLNEAILNLGFQVDRLESEMETLHANTKKKKLDKDKTERVEELSIRLEAHRFHIGSLEHVLRKLDNESLEVDQINKVREDVEYYIENCQEPDFVDDDGVYDDLDLEADIDLEHSMKKDDLDDEDDIQSSPGSSINSGHSGIFINSPASKSSINGSPRKNSKSSSISSITSLPCVTTSPISSATSSVVRNLFTVTTTTTNSTSSDNGIENNSMEIIQSTPLVNGIDHSTLSSSEFQSSLLNSMVVNDISSSTAPYAVAAAVVSATSTKPTPTTNQSNKLLSSVEQNAVQVVRNHVESLKYPGFNSNNPLWRSNSVSNDSDIVPVTTATPVSTSVNQNVVLSESLKTTTFNQDHIESIENSVSLLSSISKSISSMSSTPPVPTSSLQNPLSASSLQNPLSAFQPVTTPLMHELDKQLQSPGDFSLKGSSLFGGVLSPALTQKLTNTVDTQEVRLQPVHGVAPLGPVLLTQERVYQLKMLDASFHHLPQRQDSERMRPYISRSAVPIASYHHHQPPPNIDSLEFFQRLSTETLFFIFYYQEGTRAQYLAAKALKKQSWRFHTKYMMWFQRHEEPKRITDEFEEGTYILFDYEKWSQRKRDGFTFEYRYLEDKDLP